MTHTTPWVRYLLAKISVDDRALNRYVFGALKSVWSSMPETATPRVLELGAGIGTMVARLVDWGLLRRAEYHLLDLQPVSREVGLPWLTSWAQARGLQMEAEGESARLHGPGVDLVLRWTVQDVFAYVEEAPPESVDLLVAHAFLDLVDLPTLLPRLWSLLRPGGWAYFTLNFDAGTVFLPERPELEEDFLMDRYHASMDRRVFRGRPGGSSRTGRRLLDWAVEAPQVHLLAAGPSDWVVHPDARGQYPGDEAFFLAYILETVYDALRRDPEVGPHRARMWYDLRRGDLEAGRLIYLAHQWDLLLQRRT